MKKRMGWMLAGLLVCGAVRGAEELNLWRTPEFRDRFMGTYGVNGETEPRVSESERGQMERIMNLLAEEEAGDKALDYLKKQAKPSASAVFDFTLANLYFQREDLHAAAQWYQSAIDKFPAFRRAWKNLGMVHVRSGRFESAIGPLTRCIELGENDGLLFGLLGYAFMATDRLVSAECAYRQAVLLQSDVMDWQLGLARCFFKQQKYADAAALCSQLIRKQPESADFWLLQANAFIGMKQPLKAAQNYEYVHLLGKTDVQSLNNLGDIYVNEKMMEQAAEAYLAALELAPEQAPERPVRNAEVLAARGALPEAARLLETVRTQYGDRLDAPVRGRVLKLQARIAVAEGADERQAALLEEIVRDDPLDGEALILLGQHHARAGDAETAAFYYERAAGIERFEADAKVRHAQLLAGASKFAEAATLLKRAQELKPREDVARYLEQVERLARTRR